MASRKARRAFLKKFFYLISISFLPQASSKNLSLNKMKVYGLGAGTPLLSFAKNKTNKDSVFFVFSSLKSFLSRKLPIKEGHSIERLNDKELVCVPGRGQDGNLFILAESNQKIKKTIKLLDGYGPSGHVFNDFQAKKLYIPIEKNTVNSDAYGGQARLVVYNYKKHLVEKNIKLPGIAPHQVGILPTKGHIVISLYGQRILNKKTSAHKYSYPDSKILILDSKTLSVIKEIKAPGNGYLSHFAIDDSDSIYVPLIDYVHNNVAGHKEIKKRMGLTKNFISLTTYELKKNEISAPEPVILIDTNTFKIKTLKSNNLISQRGPQSIYYHKRTKEIFITYFVSDQLMIINTLNGQIKFLSAFDLGLENIRGLAGDTSRKEIYISGYRFGLSVLDDQKLNLKKKLRGHTYGAAHIFNPNEKY